ncbi:MAG: glycosyltransferase family A protein [Actinomycetota bacterium]
MPADLGSVSNMNDPIATIVITTRNRAVLARRAIASALAQTIQEIEVIVVDDASDEAFAWEEGNPRVRIVRREVRGGVCAARNAGLVGSFAQGDSQTLGGSRWCHPLDDPDSEALLTL